MRFTPSSSLSRPFSQQSLCRFMKSKSFKDRTWAGAKYQNYVKKFSLVDVSLFFLTPAASVEFQVQREGKITFYVGGRGLSYGSDLFDLNLTDWKVVKSFPHAEKLVNQLWERMKRCFSPRTVSTMMNCYPYGRIFLLRVNESGIDCERCYWIIKLFFDKWENNVHG